jgi:hypothetical protein
MSASDRRRAQAKPSTGDVNRMRQTRYDRRRAQAQPSTGDVNRMRQKNFCAGRGDMQNLWLGLI